MMNVPGAAALVPAAGVLLAVTLTLGCQARAETDDADRTASRQPSGSEAQDRPRYGFGTPATAAQIEAWDRDVGPDGAGLPPGSGAVREGLELYQDKCAVCHGEDGSGGTFERIAGRVPGDAFDFATTPGRASTVGSYWPYATTLFDYTRRAMPFDAPGTLTDRELYAIVGAVLYLNDLVEIEAVMDSATITDLVMPSRDRFVPDDRSGGPIIR